MNQSIGYTYTSDPRGQQSSNQMSDLQGLSAGFHPSSYQSATYTTSNSSPYGNSGSFIPSNGTIVQQGRSQQTIRIQQSEDDSKITNMMGAYFMAEPSTSSSWNTPTHSQNVQGQLGQQLQPQISYQNGNLLSSAQKLLSMSPDKSEKERLKKARQAEAARMRYHRLTPQQKRELNLKRTMAQKRKRQREKELEELDSILRETNDIQEDPDITEQLREKRMRAKWAEAARARYARMSQDERKAHNNRRRMRQMQNALAAVKASQAAGGTGDSEKDEEAVRRHIKMQNAKKAEAARMRYHRMTDDEKRLYNQRRTEAFRRRRMEEEMLLAMPIGRITGDALDRAQQIVVRNAKRAEAARARYQKMTPDQRKNYNQKRYTPKRRSDGSDILCPIVGQLPATSKKEELDALQTLERDVMKRTQQAQQAIKRQQANNNLPGSSTPGPSQSQGSYIIQSAPSQGHISQQPGVQIQLSGGGQQVMHVPHHMQQIPSQHTIITQQSVGAQSQFKTLDHALQGFQTLPTSQSHVVVQAPTTGHLVVHHQNSHPVTYTTNGNMMISGQQPMQQQVINPYPQRN